MSGFTTFAAAADDKDQPVDLGNITVHASPFGRAADDLTQPVDVLAGTQLERKRKTTIGETLEGELGVATSDFGPGVGRPIIRGQAGPRVQVLENGIGSMDLSSASDDHAVTIDPADAQQVEIIKGPATLIYGSGASGGVVNVVNNRLAEKYDDGLHARVDASYADNGNDRNSSANVDYGLAGTMIHLDGAERRALGDFKIPGNTQPDGGGTQGYIPNSAVRTQSVGVGATNLGDWGSVGMAASLYNNRYGVPGEVGTTKYLDM
ncbi:MAG TPA: TonB-dependent receptor plug domain-containing protein, partial [Nevskiaceae bacterium]|nr:TonB-dependent receptor plug domain-containing protein [Nevskiaceae bacterium]